MLQSRSNNNVEDEGAAEIYICQRDVASGAGANFSFVSFKGAGANFSMVAFKEASERASTRKLVKGISEQWVDVSE